MKGSVFWLNAADLPGSNAYYIGDLPGVVFDDALPRRLLSSLSLLASVGTLSARTGIANHVKNAFEGYDGLGWSSEYFDEVANCRHSDVEEWASQQRRLAARIIGLRSIEPAYDDHGRRFASAVVRRTTAGIGWHHDNAHIEYPKSVLDLGPHAKHYSVITYLNTPAVGGELEIACWKPADSGQHPRDSYPLDEGLFLNAKRKRISPCFGRTVLVSSEYAHRVRPTVGNRKFITMFVAVGEGRAISFG